MTKLENVADIYPLAPTQAGMLFQTLSDPDSAVYTEQAGYRLSGPLDVEKFLLAWEKVTERHAPLRSAFVWEGLDEPLQVVRKQVGLPYVELDWRDKDPSQWVAARNQFAEIERGVVIGLNEAPVWNITLLRLSDTIYEMIWTYHHIILDGWSASIIINEVLDYYEGLVSGQSIELAKAPQFKRFVAWIKKQDRDAAKRFWQSHLAGFDQPTTLPLPTREKRAEAEHKTFLYATEERSLSKASSAALNRFARQERLTLNTVIQGAWGILLSRYSLNNDVVFGATVSGRPPNLKRVGDIAGMFLNMVPVRATFDQDTDLVPWLRKLQSKQLDMQQYDYISVAELQAWSEVPSGQSLVETLLVFENYPAPDANKARTIDIDYFQIFGQTDYPLSIFIDPGERLRLQAVYNGHLYTQADMSALLKHLCYLLENMLRLDPQTATLNDISLLSVEETHDVISRWNDTEVPYAESETIPSLFDAQAARVPDKAALILNNREMSYATLQARSNRLAHHLREIGIGPNVLVGVALQRSFDMVVSLLAIVKAGGAYVPLDPNYPAERLKYIMDDAQIQLLLTQGAVLSDFPEVDVPTICVERFDDTLYPSHSPEPDGSQDDIFFTPYTSGSTGRPKGVMGHQRGVLNRCRWQWETYPLSENEVTCQKTTLNFVDHLFEIWGTLLKGNTLLLAPDEVVKDGAAFIHLLADYEIERLTLVPAFMQVLLETYPDLPARLPKLKYWTLSGEAISQDLAERFREALPNGVMLNFYGMSEGTQDVTWYDDRWQIEADSVPIGKPLDNTKVYLLDQALQPVPVGLPGEIYVSGISVAHGYLGREDLTKERFFKNHLLNGSAPTGYEKLYKTGDLGRWLPSGHVEYLGRADNQIKIRGFRIEPGEIEAMITAHPNVKQTLVLPTKVGSDIRLIAYLTVARSIDADQLRDFARERLPDYMVPSHFEIMERFPTTPNGKINRRGLPDPASFYSASSDEILLDTDMSKTESQLLEMWRSLLGHNQIGLQDPFFDVGGHSLLALRLFSQIKKVFEVNLPLSTLFDAPDIARLARTIDQHLYAPEEVQTWNSLVPIQSEGERPPLYCIHGAGGNVLIYYELAQHLKGAGQPVYGLQSIGLDGVQAVHHSIEEMAAAYADEIMRHNPSGPYFLTGYCMGGTIALETARQIQARGGEVPFLGLIETYNWVEIKPPSRMERTRFLTEKLVFHFLNFWQLNLPGKRSFLGEKWQALKDRIPVWIGSIGSGKKSDDALVDGDDPAAVLAAVWANNDEASLRYRPTQYDGVIHHFRPRKEYTIYSRPNLGWDAVAGDGVYTHRLRAYPAGSMVEPYVADLSSELALSIDEACQRVVSES